MVVLIGVLYDVERKLRAKYFGSDGSKDIDAFAQERRDVATPTLQKIESYLATKELEVPPQTALGKAIAYTRELLPRLVRYLECHYLTPDNNEAERANQALHDWTKELGNFGRPSRRLRQRRSIFLHRDCEALWP